jgi:hypothetical protein
MNAPAHCVASCHSVVGVDHHYVELNQGSLPGLVGR